MSAPVDVLAVLDDLIAPGESARGIWDTNQRTGEAFGDEVREARAAVAELIEAADTADLWSDDKVTRITARLRLNAALARVGASA